MEHLELSDYEARELRKFYKEDALPQFIQHNEGDAWYGIQIGGNMFDLNIWRDDANICATVYPCYELGDNWETDTNFYYVLDKEEVSK